MSDPKQVYEGHIAAFNAKDADAEPFSDDAVFVAPGGTMTGREEVLGFLGAFWEGFPDAHNAINRLVAEGGVTAAEGTFTGTHNGTLRLPDGEIPPTGRSVELRWSAICEVRGEQLVREHLYFDRVDLMTQLGVDQAGSAAATSS